MTKPSLSFGPFKLDAAGLLWRDGKPEPLGGRGAALLGLLASRRNETVTKAELMDVAWPNLSVEESNLSVQIATLRKQLGAEWIHTVARVGYKLVDLEGPEAEAPVAPDAVVPARVAPTGNLARYLVECVLRDDEIAAVAQLVRDHRLVSIAGPGGVGKTTLALAVANSLKSAFADGVWVIDLAAISAPTAIESAVIETMAIAFRPGASELETVAAALRDQHVLVVLDNCEHLAGAASAFVRELLGATTAAKVLTTTQLPLGLPSEHVFKLAPFNLAIESDSMAARFVGHCYAQRGETLEAGELAAVVRLCRGLDGLALPLKLAAAQAAVVGFASVEEQLRNRLDGSREGGRQATLRNSLQWSYGLLGTEEQRVFRALAVFQGSFSMAAATEVAEAQPASLADLVQRSMLVRDATNRSRYRLLEPFRLFALDLLASAGDEDNVRERHARFMAGLFRQSLDTWETTPDDDWVALYQPDSANLRGALEWAEAKPDWPLFAALTAGSHRYWFQIGLPTDQLKRCEIALEADADIGVETRAIIWVGAKEYEVAVSPRLAELVDIDAAIRALQDERHREILIQALILKGVSFEFADDSASGRPLFAEASRLVADMPDSKLKARVLVTSGLSQWSAGDKQAGRIKIDAGLGMHQAFRNASGYGISSIYPAEGMHRDGDTTAAIELTLETLAYVRAHCGPITRVTQLHNLMSYLLSQGRAAEARAYREEVLTLAPDTDHSVLISLMQSFAELAALDADTTRACLLLGYADAGTTHYAGGRQTTEQLQLQRTLAALAAQGTDDNEVARLRAQGAQISAFEARRLMGMAG